MKSRNAKAKWHHRTAVVNLESPSVTDHSIWSHYLGSNQITKISANHESLPT